MNYQWDIKAIEKQKRQLIKELIFNYQLSYDERRKIKTLISKLNWLINPDKKEDTTIPDLISSFNYHLFNNETFFFKRYLQDFKKIPPNYINLINETVFLLDSIPNTYKSFHSLKLSMEEIVDFTKDFYKWLKRPDYLHEINKYLNPENHYLEVSKNLSSDYNGLCQIIYNSSPKPYFLFYPEHTTIDLYVLNHEFAHGIYAKDNLLENLKKANFYLGETEGFIFDDLTSTFLVSNHFPINEIKKANHNSLVLLKEAIQKFYIGKLMADCYEKNHQIDIVKIQKLIFEAGLNWEIDEISLINATQSSPRLYLIDILSFLSYLDLKYQTEDDIETRLIQLDQLKKDQNPHILTTLKKQGLTFMHDGFVNFQQEIQKTKVK